MSRSLNIVRPLCAVVIGTALLAGVGVAPVQARPQAVVPAVMAAEVADEPTAGPPSVTGVSPIIGAAGTSVAVEGGGFAAAPTDNVVTLNGVPVSVDEATSTGLTVLVPAGATSGRFEDVTPDGAAVGPDFTVPPQQFNTWVEGLLIPTLKEIFTGSSQSGV